MGKSSTVVESKIHIISVSTYLLILYLIEMELELLSIIKKKVIKYSDQVPIPIKF